MTDITVATLGASRVDPDTRLPVAQAKIAWGNSDDESEDFGECAMYGSIGVTCLPAPSDDRGSCEAIVARDVGGLDGVIIGARDERSAGVTAEMKGGESCFHSTGKGYDSRLFCKDQSVSMVVGNDTAFVLDRKAGTATLAIGGSVLQIGKKGILMSGPDGSFIKVMGGIAQVSAPIVQLGVKQTLIPAAAIGSGGPTASTTVFVDDPASPI